MILGHEFVGEVVEADPDSETKIGDLVATGAGIWCGTCRRCRDGRTNQCATYKTLGLNVDGGMVIAVLDTPAGKTCGQFIIDPTRHWV